MKKIHTIFQSHKHNHTDLNPPGCHTARNNPQPKHRAAYPGSHSTTTLLPRGQSHRHCHGHGTPAHGRTVTTTLTTDKATQYPQVPPHILCIPQSHNHTPLWGQTLSHSPSQKLLTPPHTITTYNLQQVITRTSPGHIPSHRHSHGFSDS